MIKVQVTALCCENQQASTPTSCHGQAPAFQARVISIKFEFYYNHDPGRAGTEFSPSRTMIKKKKKNKPN